MDGKDAQKQLHALKGLAAKTSQPPYVGFNQFGMAMGIICFEGRQLILAMQDKGDGLKQQLDRAQALNGQDLIKEAKKSGFALVQDPGGLVLLPSGYIYCYYRVADVFCLTWSMFLATWRGEGQRVHSAMAHIMAAYPALKEGGGVYPTLLNALEVQSTKKHQG